jgi:hypothetical protein
MIEQGLASSVKVGDIIATNHYRDDRNTLVEVTAVERMEAPVVAKFDKVTETWKVFSEAIYERVVRISYKGVGWTGSVTLHEFTPIETMPNS